MHKLSRAITYGTTHIQGFSIHMLSLIIICPRFKVTLELQSNSFKVKFQGQTPTSSNSKVKHLTAFDDKPHDYKRAFVYLPCAY